jgi:predicted metal-dependent hydrolase
MITELIIPVTTNNTSIDLSCLWEPKKRRHTKIQMRYGGILYVSSPMFYTETDVHKIVHQNLQWVVSQYWKMKDRKPSMPTCFYNAETYTADWLGDTYPVVLVKPTQPISTQNPVVRFENEIFTIQTTQTQQANQFLAYWFQEKAQGIVAQLLSVWQPILTKHNLAYRHLGYKLYKNRWGCCDMRKDITLNLFLFQKPLYCIEYVFWHECCHLMYMHHKPSFWALLGSEMPDWKTRSAMMQVSC